MGKLTIILRLLIFFTTFLLGKTSMAQLCQGSLGNPVVNITFGSGANPGAPLDPAITNYNYVPYSCPADGEYTIGNSSSACFNDTWHVLPEDHTANDTSGYMMIVNASYTPGDFYVNKVDGLCDNTTYEFAAWILNILRPTACGNNGIKPNVTFAIETVAGTVLQSYKTGDIAASDTPQWKQYGLFFTTPVNTNSIVIRITNNAPGGCGNDLVLDDITFRPCGPLVTISINNTSKSINLCQGDTSSLTFTSTVTPIGNNTTYQWQESTDQGITWNDIPGATNSSYTRLAVGGLGVYQYRVAVAQGNYILTPSCSRVLSDPIIVNQVALPIPNASNNGPVCEGSSLILNSTAGSAYSWTGPLNFTSNQQSPAISNVPLNYNGKFYVKLTSVDGCVNTDSTTATIIPGPLVNAGNDATICEGQSTMLTGITNASNYVWQPAQSLSDPQILNPVAT
ncbi:MAG: hypothetical protein M3Z92_05875, partial [Bacteroidota bacterium]|nr:hypothetical protein [Bacteroidota bacterium]